MPLFNCLAKEADPAPDSADMELEEAEPEQAPPEKKKRKPPKTKKKFGKSARTGGDRKCYANATNRGPPVTNTNNPTTTTAPAPTRKTTKAELIKIAGYAKREMRSSQRKAATFKEELKAQEAALDSKSKEHSQAVALGKAALDSKSKECNDLAKLAQQHRKAANTSQFEADSKVAKMTEDSRVYHQDADAKVLAAEADAIATIRAERAYQHEKLITKTNKHSKEIEQLKQNSKITETEHKKALAKELKASQSSFNAKINIIQKEHGKETNQLKKSNEKRLKEKDDQLSNITKQRDIHKVGEQDALLECHQLKLAHTKEIDRLTVEHKAEMREVKAELRAALAESVSASALRVSELQDEQVELMITYHGMVDENADYRRQLTSFGKKIKTVSATSQQRLLKMREVKDQHSRCADEVRREKIIIE